jgi:GTP-binding protein
VGKSSLINSLTSSERVIVSPVAGTTRDSVDVPFTVTTEGREEHYVLIDTAGLRKRRSVDESVEFFSVKRAEESVKRSDIVIFVLDAQSGILMQDKKIADLIVEERKPCIVVVNKWDLMAEDVARARTAAAKKSAGVEFNRDRPKASPSTLAEFAGWVQERLFFLDYAPVIFTSAKDGFNLGRLLEAVRFVSAQMLQRVPTALLNRTLREAIERRGPISSRGHLLNFFYATQVQTTPPKFLLFVNNEELFNPAYEKYLCGELRKAFGFEGCPIVLQAKARSKTIAPKRDRQTKNAQKSQAGGASRKLGGARRRAEPRKNRAGSGRFQGQNNEPR